ncbi:hypothetical protein QR680_011892 [Steinernema hermaphroditum]|uniref:DNA-directed DNA polymerase n=1 Tax=Steinernema hermaphroditum TaxID=289476 RepID=A0AA39I1N0_9BILA|nr:hypothetical protein QR680_011892 [Steinernema hermaphroditum]
MSHRTRSTQHATHGEVQRRSFIVRERFPHQLANRKTADRSDTSDTTSTLPITIFDFDKEIIEYCKNDVFLLAEGCLKFRQEFLPSTDLDCFKVSTTIPSASIKNFKSFLLREKTIAHIPELGYFARQGCQRKEKTNRLSRRVALIHAKDVEIAEVSRFPQPSLQPELPVAYHEHYGAQHREPAQVNTDTAEPDLFDYVYNEADFEETLP